MRIDTLTTARHGTASACGGSLQPVPEVGGRTVREAQFDADSRAYQRTISCDCNPVHCISFSRVRSRVHHEPGAQHTAFFRANMYRRNRGLAGLVACGVRPVVEVLPLRVFLWSTGSPLVLSVCGYDSFNLFIFSRCLINNHPFITVF